MSPINQYIDRFQLHNRIIKGKTDEFTHDDSMCQLPFPGNCMNWNLGHLLVYRIQNLGLIDGHTQVDGTEFSLYGAGSKPLIDSNIAIPLEILLIRLEESSNTIIAELEQMSLARLDEIIDEENGTTVLQRLNFYFLFHEAYHIGQLELLQELVLSHK